MLYYYVHTVTEYLSYYLYFMPVDTSQKLPKEVHDYYLQEAEKYIADITGVPLDKLERQKYILEQLGDIRLTEFSVFRHPHHSFGKLVPAHIITLDSNGDLFVPPISLDVYNEYYKKGNSEAGGSTSSQEGSTE